MKAVIMAGGEGTRLRPLTYNQPKPMVPMANRPLMEHVIGLGTAGSVRNAMQQLDEPFLVISGDVLTDIDLGGRPAGPHGAAGLSRRPELLRPT